MPNWTDPGDYAYTDDLDGSGWAWEFLRRNHRYCRDWRTFMQTWRALEADYGQAPNRDFARWKLDPRANLFEPPREADETVTAWTERTGNDCVAIECAFGARWGLYKFPPDPERTAPELGDALCFREYPEVAKIITPDSSYLGQNSAQIALGFDLDRPLKSQLDEARRFLIARQHHLRRDSGLTLRTVATQKASWRLGLRLLDALEADAKAGTIAQTLFDGDRDRYTDQLHQALALHDDAYRALPGLPVK
ncbi:MAG: hypothetical protein H6981_12790 [Gammaproteobacteria bacterium]|nr:hypothetical protein [Gammaproteobacteria bacterium]MCP5137664.1 hypothetical protein [Gammaproteobacteria bacterium]